MTKYNVFTVEEITEAIRAGKTAEEVALLSELYEVRAMLLEAVLAMTPTAACQSVVYSDIMRYFDELEARA